ncbi:unnamed protein product [Musa textilis]
MLHISRCRLLCSTYRLCLPDEAAVREGKIRTYIHDSHASPSYLSQLIEQARKRPHGTHLHLQRLDVVGRLLEQPLRAQLLASGDQPLQRSDPCLYLHRLVLVRSLSQVSPHLRGSQRLVLAPAAVTCRSPPEEEEAAAECAAPVAVTGGPGEAHLRCHLYPTTPLNEPGPFKENRTQLKPTIVRQHKVNLNNFTLPLDGS